MSVLHIRDENGNFIPINALRGKSAYEQAREGGYQGEEPEFLAALARINDVYNVSTQNTEHNNSKNNPHGVTAQQVGALSLAGGTTTGRIFLNNGYAEIRGILPYVMLTSYKNKKDEENKTELRIRHTDDVAHRVDLVVKDTDRPNDEGEYTLYGEHNKPQGTYSGQSGTESQILQIGGVGGTVLITSSLGDISFVTSAGVRSLLRNTNYFSDLSATAAYYMGGKLTVKNSTPGISEDGVSYRYQVL